MDLTIPQAAEFYGVSMATIRRWIKRGRVASQLTLGPYGEQWMVQAVDPKEVQRGDTRPTASGSVPPGYVALGECVDQPDLVPDFRAPVIKGDPPLHGSAGDQLCSDEARGGMQQVLREAEQALEEAHQEREEALRDRDRWRERAEQIDRLQSDLQQLKQEQAAERAARALQADLAGSEAARHALQAQVDALRAERDQAWQETRTALRSLAQAYEWLEQEQQARARLERESDTLRRALAHRLGLAWQEHELPALFLQWEASPRNSGEASWSQFRRQPATVEDEVG